MAKTLLSFGVQKLCDLLVRESERFQGVEEQFNELKSDLNLLRSYLEDAEAKKHASALVRNCVEQIKEIVFDAEDVIETFLLKEELRKTSGIKKQLRRLFFTTVDRKEIASDMGGISKMISKVIHNLQSFGVQQMIVEDGENSQPLQESQRETLSSNYENDIVGFEENVQKLVGRLVEEDSIRVVSITGMGGIGKTTLARSVFNHEMVKNHFDRVVWVCISQQFTRKYVWQTILQMLSPKHDEYRDADMSEVELQEKLFRLLETSKSLIVLDDMWKGEDWDIIKPAFPSTKGWKILLTSRNENVAFHVDPTCVTFKPACLSYEESWTLFQMIAFPMKDTTECEVDVEMEKIGRQMIKHCGGLPFAVKVLGGLLAAQHTLSDWKRISENIVGGTSYNNEYTRVDHILFMSFEELPIYLKHCFLYLAHFPEDYTIHVKNLSYYWAAEGIPKPMYYDGATILEVAYRYIEELVKRHMVISKRDARTSRFETCHLHDMMREVCLVKAKEENFVHILDTSHVTSITTSQSCKSRRLAIHSSDGTGHMDGYIQNPRLRSLLFIKQSPLLNMIESGLCITKLQLMRILDLSYAKFEGGKLPSNIGNLIHLRYLSLYLAKVSHLPSSMRNLRKLLYLNLCVAAGSPVYIPNFVKKMRELIYLFLPEYMQDKTKLELGTLTNLETLENFSTKHSSVKDFHGMRKLTTLSILLHGEGCTMETLSSSLGESRHLENLTISNHKSDKKEYVLDGIHLQQLKLTQAEQHFPSHLTTISLRHCYLTDDPMPILEKLLHLKEVCLGERSFCGGRMVCSAGGFPQLQKLIMKKLVELEEWIVEEGSMPCLHTLSIHYCDRFKEVPDGLKFITSLEELTIIIIEREFKKKLSKGGKYYYKVQHIPLVKVYGCVKI